MEYILRRCPSGVFQTGEVGGLFFSQRTVHVSGPIIDSNTVTNAICFLFCQVPLVHVVSPGPSREYIYYSHAFHEYVHITKLALTAI